MNPTTSLATLNNGGIVEAVDIALQKIAENIADPNTPADRPRKLTLKLTFKPDKNRNFTTMTANVETSLQNDEPQEIAMLLDEREGVPVLFEAYAGMNPNQHHLPGALPGEIREGDGKAVNNVTPFKAHA